MRNVIVFLLVVKGNNWSNDPTAWIHVGSSLWCDGSSQGCLSWQECTRGSWAVCVLEVRAGPEQIRAHMPWWYQCWMFPVPCSVFIVYSMEHACRVSWRYLLKSCSCYTSDICLTSSLTFGKNSVYLVFIYWLLWIIENTIIFFHCRELCTCLPYNNFRKQISSE